MWSWLKKIFSSDTDASYGRFISFMAYLCLAISPYLILRNYTILNDSQNATSLIKTVIQYLFYLSALGYCASNAKDVLLGLFKSPEKLMETLKKSETTPNDTPEKSESDPKQTPEKSDSPEKIN